MFGHSGPGQTASFGPQQHVSASARGSSIQAAGGAPSEVRWPGKLSESERFALLGGEALPSKLSEVPHLQTPPARRLPSTAPIPAPPEFLASTDSPTNAQANPFTGRETARVPASHPKSHVPFSSGMTDRIRVASFNVDPLGPSKLDKSHVMSLLVTITRQYDIVAFQGVQSTRDDILPLLVERLNQSGRHYDYIIGPRVGRAGDYQQFAFVFDTDRVETDRYRLYTVDDPDDLMTFEPLVGWFRCKGPETSQAFTFSLINVKIAAQLAAPERAILGDLVRAIQRDGRGEDDWIVLGDIGGDTAGLQSLEAINTRFAIREIPTEVTGMRMLDSIFFDMHATSEYSGRSGAYDFLRKHNMAVEQALEISSHLPVWAEFTSVEGGLAGAAATPITPPVRPQTQRHDEVF
ncbi:MAG TPA: deoxyribonuclease I [Planctomycetaceae bacterium]|nr:deoxyribonuclease I [Planctomycetaceae bacterium]